MASVNAHFLNDFLNYPVLILDKDCPIKITEVPENEGSNILVKSRNYLLASESIAFSSCYIGFTSYFFDVCIHIIENFELYYGNHNGVKISGQFKLETLVGNNRTTFSRKFFIYTENELDSDQLEELGELAGKHDLYVAIRSQKYCMDKKNSEIPSAFISHDSKDKDIIARPLATGLASRLTNVWYDEFTLEPGDSLREKIEKGIKEAKKCILVLTPNFLSNEGWGKKEFNSIFTREMIMKENIIIPIWNGISPQEVYEYSPSLADTIAHIWPENNSPEYEKKVELLISKIHTQLS